MLFMSEVNPQITFARTKIILARAIFDEIHVSLAQKSFWHVPFLMRFMECGLISSTAFRWSSLFWCVPDPGSGYARLGGGVIGV